MGFLKSSSSISDPATNELSNHLLPVILTWISSKNDASPIKMNTINFKCNILTAVKAMNAATELRLLFAFQN